MQTVQEFTAGLPTGVRRSRHIIPAEHQQGNAEAILIVAGEIEPDIQMPEQVHLFRDMMILAEGKGFGDADILRSLIRGRRQSALMRQMVREVIDLLGGPGDFFDIIDMITWPDERVAQ